MKHGYVYILANDAFGTLYIGVTSDLLRRMYEHKHALIDGFSKKYGLKTLVYMETHSSIEEAIAREKQLKRWHRDWKINLISEQNPDWKDLSLEWFEESSLGLSAPEGASMDAETSSA